jgi:hypothetical protein
MSMRHLDAGTQLQAEHAHQLHSGRLQDMHMNEAQALEA